GAVLDQELAEPVVAVLRGREQRAPTVARRLVHVGAGLEQHARGLDAARARRVDERRQLAAVGLARTAATAAGRRVVVLVVGDAVAVGVGRITGLGDRRRVDRNREHAGPLGALAAVVGLSGVDGDRKHARARAAAAAAP